MVWHSLQVWENNVSSGSEEVLRNSNDSLNASSIAEEISTDDSFGHLNMSARSRSKKSSQHELRSGCLPVGYIPQVNQRFSVRCVKQMFANSSFLVSWCALQSFRWEIWISDSCWPIIALHQSTICRPIVPTGSHHGFWISSTWEDYWEPYFLL